jgi:hypothetical protein
VGGQTKGPSVLNASREAATVGFAGYGATLVYGSIGCSKSMVNLEPLFLHVPVKLFSWGKVQNAAGGQRSPTGLSEYDNYEIMNMKKIV